MKLLFLLVIAIAGIVTTTFNKNGSNKVIVNSDTGYGEYSGDAYIVINNNEPSFTQVSTGPYLDVSLDSYGRATEAKA